MSALADMKPLDAAMLFRDAAEVKRYHAKRTLRTQTVGAHSFNVMVLIQQVWPLCRKELLLAAMHHDFPELVTGDIPAPIKRAHPDLGPLLDHIEEGLAPLYHDFGLTAPEAAVLKWADRMELVLWCVEEYRMGNTYTKDIIRRGLGWIISGGLEWGLLGFTQSVVTYTKDELNIDPATGAELEMQK